LDLNENPLVTLKKRFPRLDTNLRDNLETLGEELQECALEVKKWKKSYGMFVVPFGSDLYVVKSINIENNLKIPDVYKDDTV
jgi:hypothetical protein